MASLYSKIAAFTLLSIVLIGGLTSDLSAQWRLPNSPESITVKPDGKVVNAVKQLTLGVDMYVQVSGTFSLFAGQQNEGVDAAYTYKVPNWNIFTPMSNPPVYQGAQFNWGFEYQNNGTTFLPFYNQISKTPVYQSNHSYSVRVPSQGNTFSFRIKAPSASYYTAGTGNLRVTLTRWTAGLCVKKDSIEFGLCNVNQKYTFLDSLASYGIDPLSIDSIKLFGSSDFAFQSSRPNSFTLATQTASELAISVTPSATGNIYGEIHIYCHNADPLNRDRKIKLHATGAAPNPSVGPDSLNFGKVRINFPIPGSDIKHTNISNFKGNATLTMNSANYVPADNIFSQKSPALPLNVKPLDVTPNSSLAISTIFKPQARQHYHSRLDISGPSSSVVYHIDLQGDGAEPVPELSTKLINFGTIYRGDGDSKTVTLSNKGNWTCTVINAFISSSSKSAFSFTPNDTTFFLEPDSSRTFTITFHPQTGQENWIIRGEFILVYDDNTRDTVVLNGTEIQPKYQLTNHFYDFGKVKIPVNGLPYQPIPKAVDTIFAPTTTVTMQPLELRQPPNFFSFPFTPQSHQNFPVIPPDSVQLWVSFAPLQVGPWQTYLYVNDGYKKDSILLQGIGAVAKAIFNPYPLSFGTVPSNTPIDSVTMLTDSGDYELRIVRYEITGPDKNDFKVMYESNGGKTHDTPYTLIEGSSIPIDVRFFTNARTGLVHRATLCVYYDDSTSDCIPLEAIEEAQFLQFGQTSVDFGKVRVGLDSLKEVKFVNNAGKSLKVDSLSTDPNPLFTALKTTLSVPAGTTDSINVKVQFSPKTRGQFSGLLTGRGGDFIESSIELRGTGAAPEPKFSTPLKPDTVDCGIVKLGLSGSSGFSLLNLGDWTLEVTNIQIVNDKFNEFKYIKSKSQIIGDIVDTILEGDPPSSYQIIFTPQKTTVYHQAKMIFTYDDGTTGTVVLEGYDESDHLVLDNDTVNFGKIRIGTPASRSVKLVSTSPLTLTADNVHLDGPPQFTTTTKLGKITVLPRELYDINITCTPTTIGPLSAQLITDTCIGSAQDTTFIFAIGAEPLASFPSDTLDFGQLFNGYSRTLSIDLTNKGNWDLSIVSSTIAGNEALDFTAPKIPQSFTLAEQVSNPLEVTFKAATAYQAAPRYGEIDFTLDDGSKFILYLKAQDIAPIVVDLKFDNSNMRLEDKVYPNLRLMSAIPDSLNVNHIHGIVNYDPAVVSAPITVQGTAMLEGWTLTTPTFTNPPGQYEYDLQSTTKHLSTPGPLLRFEFKAANGARIGDQTSLQHSSVGLPTRTEFILQERQGIIVIDSACGSTHLLQGGKAQTNFIEMNSPNPFGSGAMNDATNMTFAIAEDGTPVTLRVLDITGKEVFRMLDQQIFAQGFYQIRLSSNDLPNSGTYLYEFRAGNDRPTVRKMIVRK